MAKQDKLSTMKKNLVSKEAGISALQALGGVAAYLIIPSLLNMSGFGAMAVGAGIPILIGAAMDYKGMVIGTLGAALAHVGYAKTNGPFNDIAGKNFWALDPNALTPPNIPGGSMNDEYAPNYSGEYIQTSQATDLPPSMSDYVHAPQLPPAVQGYGANGYGVLADDSAVWDAIEQGVMV